MSKSYWLINSNKSEVKRFMKNDKSIDGVFEYIFIDTGKILEGLGSKPPVMTNTISVSIFIIQFQIIFISNLYHTYLSLF